MALAQAFEHRQWHDWSLDRGQVAGRRDFPAWVRIPQQRAERVKQGVNVSGHCPALETLPPPRSRWLCNLSLSIALQWNFFLGYSFALVGFADKTGLALSHACLSGTNSTWSSSPVLMDTSLPEFEELSDLLLLEQGTAVFLYEWASGRPQMLVGCHCLRRGSKERARRERVGSASFSLRFVGCHKLLHWLNLFLVCRMLFKMLGHGSAAPAKERSSQLMSSA